MTSKNIFVMTFALALSACCGCGTQSRDIQDISYGQGGGVYSQPYTPVGGQTNDRDLSDLEQYRGGE